MNIKQLLREYSPIPGNLSDSSLTELINLSHEVHVPGGERIKSVVATSDCLYIVLDGQFISTMASGFEGDRTQSYFAAGETLDEIEQRGEVNDCCEFLAVVDSRILCIPREYYVRLMTS